MPTSGGGDAADTGLRLLLLDPFVWEDLPDGFEERVVHAAHATQQDEPDTPLAFARRPRRPRFLAVALAAAAMVAIALGLTLPSGGDDPRRVELAATELAPDAGGTVAIDERAGGVEFTLRASGLPPAPEGHFYQAWVKGPLGPVAIGTFHLRQGDDRVKLWSGVDLADYPTLTVTLQEEGAGPASSGKVVLTAAVG